MDSFDIRLSKEQARLLHRAVVCTRINASQQDEEELTELDEMLLALEPDVVNDFTL